MALMYWCDKCGKYHKISEDCPQLRAIVPARRPEELHGSPSVPGDSRVKVSDRFNFLRQHGTSIVTIKTAIELLDEVRRLEQIIQDANG